MKSAVDIFVQLGERLALFGEDAHSSDVIEQAVAENGWFTRSEIVAAVGALRDGMLNESKLRHWLSAYSFADVEPKRVAVIMAGNIPLVGFFDLLCVVASGHRAVVKPSGKDRVLMHRIVELLREIEPEIAIEECDNDTLKPSDVDAVIATGNDNAKRRFKALYAGKPQLLRGNRHSVAVLSGKESSEMLGKLNADIFSYSGLGCRNVSLIFIPRGYGLRLSGGAANPKYVNNYLQNRALLKMSGDEFSDTGGCLLVKSDEFPSAISRVAVREYDTLAEVSEWLAVHDEELQCVVSECVSHSRRVPFGQAQHPQLTDYPDDVDVMAFLSSI